MDEACLMIVVIFQELARTKLALAVGIRRNPLLQNDLRRGTESSRIPISPAEKTVRGKVLAEWLVVEPQRAPRKGYRNAGRLQSRVIH